MNSHCAKCAEPASALLSYDYGAGEVWIDDHHGPIVPLTGHGLCEIHANRFTAPLGWLLTDRRGPERPLFVALEVA